MIKFVTSNKNKFREVQQTLLPHEIEQLDIELDEIQDLDPKKIIQYKLKQAFEHEQGEFIVEDGSLWLECLGNKLPGPFIRWFNESIGTQGLYELTKGMGNSKAKVMCLIAYAKNSENILYFEGINTGTIVEPRGDYGFGFDAAFKPDSSDKTFGELKSEGDLNYSARAMAVTKLKEYLLSNE